MRDFPNDKLQKILVRRRPQPANLRILPRNLPSRPARHIKNTAQFAVIRWSIDGWLPKAEPGAIAARNLLGFRDGSGNPKVEDPKVADQVLWTGVAANSLDEPAWTKNGSYQAVRLIRHFVEFWDRTPMQEQTDIFGRRKYSGAPMDGKKEGDTADFAKDQTAKSRPKTAICALPIRAILSS